MQNILDIFSRVSLGWNAFNSNNATEDLVISNITSFGRLNTVGLSNPIFHYSSGREAVCVSGTVEISVNTTTFEISYNGPRSNYELTEFITDFLRRGSDAPTRYIGQQTPSSGTYKIFSKICVPASKGASDSLEAVQFLTHGGTLDASYWDFEPGYSYVDAAAKKGFATFSYDRLGIGRSDHPDPIQTVQLPLQIDIAHELIERLKLGSIGGVAFSAVTGIGHSLGAGLTQGVSAKYSDDFDAVILTGHSGFRNGAWIGLASTAWQIANTVPERPEFKDLPNGYYTVGAIPQAQHFAFFYYPYFEERGMLQPLMSARGAVFLKSFHDHKTTALGETLTLGGAYAPASDFKKPVLILNGQQDFFYCQGNCLADNDVTAEALSIFYPEAHKSKSRAITLPNMGHNINFHLGVEKAFSTMLEFVEDVHLE